MKSISLSVSRALWLSASVSLVVGCVQADATKPAATEAIPTVQTKSGLEMSMLPAGEFNMGSDQGRPDEAPKHRVSLDAFLMDRCEVTQAAYEKHVIGNPSKYKDPKNPVERVRWVEAALYCNARSTEEGLKPCYNEDTFACDMSANGYRLPTEAEWEYAARAGTSDDYSFGSDQQKLGDFAWFKENANERTHPVGKKRPNPWGLYDIYGNVGEWCQDTYDGKFYVASPEKNPCGATSGPQRTLRGGSFSSDAAHCRSATRAGEAPGNFADACFARPDIGFRCVRKAPATATNAVASAH